MLRRTQDPFDTITGSVLPSPSQEWQEAKSVYSGLASVTFPSFIELLNIESATPIESRSGNFAELLGEDHVVLWMDFLDHPECYDQDAEVLLRRLMEGATSAAQLTEEERTVLDRATIEMAIRRNNPPPIPQMTRRPTTTGTAPKVRAAPKPTAPPASVPADRWWEQ